MEKLRISVDFDGVIVTNNYPDIGELMTGAKETINKWHEKGHTILISTCRSGGYALSAYQFIINNGIQFDFFNENDPVLIEQYGSDTRKLSFDVAFDDKHAGMFLGWKRADKYIEWMENRKPSIICIIGESGSGKSTLAEYIDHNFCVPLIQSRTTRPPRYDGENGHTFVSDAEFDSYDDSKKLAYTTFGSHRYCCLTDDVKDENVYVIDEFGVKYLKANFGDKYNIKTIRVTCNKSERIQRAGQERVDRDNGKFNMQRSLFDFVWETDSRKDHSARREHEFEQLDNFIIKSLGRGWC